MLQLVLLDILSTVPRWRRGSEREKKKVSRGNPLHNGWQKAALMYFCEVLGWFHICGLASRLYGRAQECFSESVVSADILYRKRPKQK